VILSDCEKKNHWHTLTMPNTQPALLLRSRKTAAFLLSAPVRAEDADGYMLVAVAGFSDRSIKWPLVRGATNSGSRREAA
jgi:hypothetical protein